MLLIVALDDSSEDAKQKAVGFSLQVSISGANNGQFSVPTSWPVKSTVFLWWAMTQSARSPALLPCAMYVLDYKRTLRFKQVFTNHPNASASNTIGPGLLRCAQRGCH